MECLHPALLYSEALFVSPLTAEGPTSKAVNLSRSWLKKAEVVLSSSKVRSCKSQSEQKAPWKGRTVVDWWRTCTQVLYQSAKWHTCSLYFSISICSSTIFHMETCFLLHYIYLTPIITFCIKKTWCSTLQPMYPAVYEVFKMGSTLMNYIKMLLLVVVSHKNRITKYSHNVISNEGLCMMSIYTFGT